jgi:hypothetical protein
LRINGIILWVCFLLGTLNFCGPALFVFFIFLIFVEFFFFRNSFPGTDFSQGFMLSILGDGFVFLRKSQMFYIQNPCLASVLSLLSFFRVIL